MPNALALALLALLAAPATARSVRTEEATSTSTAVPEKEARRVLKLASGQTIRVLSRWKDGAWEYKGKSGWQRLDPKLVTAAELETDVLRAWRDQREKCNSKDLAARTALARWGAEHGLATEALAELDAVLTSSPDDAGALRVLRENWLLSVPSIEVPAEQELAAREELTRFGSSLPPAGREVAVNELAKTKDRAALLGELSRDLWSPIVVRRSFAALALRRIYPGEEAKPLLVHAVRDASENVRRESARALRSAGDPALVVPLIKALSSRSLSIRSNAATALGEMGYPAAVEPLVARMAAALQSSTDARAPHSNIFTGRQIAYIQDFDVEVAQFQAVADPQVNVLLEGMVTDAAVISSREEGVEVELVAIRQALEKLVGFRPGGTAREWLRWWEKEGSKWRTADHTAIRTP
jgi:hypothetical protein